MNKVLEARAGREGKKGDCSVHLVRTDAGGLSIDVTSTVAGMFGEQIRDDAKRALDLLGIGHCRLHVEDTGALDYVIQARVEAAARRLWKIDGPGCLPKERIECGPPRKLTDKEEMEQAEQRLIARQQHEARVAQGLIKE